MSCLRIQLLLEVVKWSTGYNIPENDRCSNSSTGWTILCLNFTEKNYGTKLNYDPKNTLHMGMCFTNITINHFIF